MTASPPQAWSRLLDAAELARTVRRLAHEVRERHPGLRGVVLAAVCDGGVPLACRVRDHLSELGEPEPPVLALDVRDYRDDRPRPARPAAGALSPLPRVSEGGEIPPASVEAATVVLVDRGRRELPLRATYVGRNLPVAAGAWVEVVWEPASAGAWLVEPEPATLHEQGAGG